ncbi:hypothetical protein QUA97_25350, partial [Microcoleus sp. CZ3-B2]|uniref:hypothetical protein n=1 Tax=Microcoleus sp. CZ3-B2 TaxID=2818731 RepID=UPI002FD38D44
ADTGIVTFPAIPSLPSGAPPAINTVSFIAPASASGSVKNTAKSDSSTLDPTLSNNDGTAPGASVTTILTPNQAPEATPTNLTVGPNSSAPVAG